MHRIMGMETEFGVSQPGRPRANPMRDSARVIDSFAAPRGLRSAQSFWDFAEESPLTDARGFMMSLGQADPSQLTHRPDMHPDAEYLANVVLTNGARYYVDHAHPEYSSPEVIRPRDAVLYDRAGDLVALDSVRRLAESEPVNLYKNNTDGKGSSYGSHENYLMPRTIDFDDIVAGLTPFFVSRQVITGAGRVGIGQASSRPGFQISSRADFFEAEVGLETTLRRPIINTRDEPHAVPEEYRRLHVIIGDANLAEYASLLKVGTTSLVLDLIEAGRAPSLALFDPLEALRTISHDPSVTATVKLIDGRHLSAVEIQAVYLDAARGLFEERRAGLSDVEVGDTIEVLAEWERVLEALRTDPMTLADTLDWVAKLSLLEGYRTREGLGWDHPKLALIDVQYADVRPERGLFHKLEAAGRIRRFTSEEEVRAAMDAPPADTRAYLRGRAIDKFRADIVSASWDSLVFTLPGHERFFRLPMPRPQRGTRALVGRILDESPDARSLLTALGATDIPDDGAAAARTIVTD